MTALRWIAWLLLLGLLQGFLPVVWSPLGFVDWLLIAVTFQALRGSFRSAVMVGALAGLIQDSVTGSILGLHAFAKTAVAAVISGFGSFLVVRGPTPEAAINAAASLLEGTIVTAWIVLLDRTPTQGLVGGVTRAVATAVASALVLGFAARLRARAARRRPSSVFNLPD